MLKIGGNGGSKEIGKNGDKKDGQLKIKNNNPNKRNSILPPVGQSSTITPLATSKQPSDI